MSTRYLMGFEHVQSSSNNDYTVSLASVTDKLGMDYPRINANDYYADAAVWYMDSTGSTTGTNSGAMVTASSHYIAGSALQIKRPDAGIHNVDFNGTKSTHFGPKFAANSIALFGAALKYDKVPSIPLPILQATYNSGTGDQEQLSVWADTDGSLLFSSVAFSMVAAVPITPVAIPGAVTPAASINLQEWNYLELSIDYSGAAPSVSLYVNGVALLLGLTSPALQKATTGEVDTLSVLNPLNAYFVNGYTQYIDDMYALDGLGKINNAVIGPQHIAYVTPNGPSAPAEWYGNSLQDNYTLLALRLNIGANALGLRDYYTSAGLPAGTGDISSVALVVGALKSFYSGTVRTKLRSPSGELYMDSSVLGTGYFFGMLDYSFGGSVWDAQKFNACDFGLEYMSAHQNAPNFEVFAVVAYVATRASKSLPNALISNGEDTAMIYSDVIFPECVTYGSSGVPKYTTDKIEVSSGAEQRQQRWAYPKHQYTIQLKNMPPDEYSAVLNLWHTCSGEQTAFMFLDPFDHTSNNTVSSVTGSVVTPLDQAVGTGTGVATYYDLYKTYTSGGHSKSRRIRYPKAGTLVVALDGYTVTNFAYSYTTGKLSFTTGMAPTTWPRNKTGDIVDFVGGQLKVNDLVYITGFTVTADDRPASGYPLRVIAVTYHTIQLQNYDGTVYTGTDETGDQLTITPALPPAGAIITAGYYFYTPVRFDKPDAVNASMVAGMRESAFSSMSSVSMIEVFE